MKGLRCQWERKDINNTIKLVFLLIRLLQDEYQRLLTPIFLTFVVCWHNKVALILKDRQINKIIGFKCNFYKN